MRTSSVFRVVLPILIPVVSTYFSLGAEPRAPRVYRDKIEPRWLAHDNAFWYRVATGPGRYEFVYVDTEKGLRRTAFDHERMAEAFAKTGLPGISEDNLPLEALEFADGEIRGFRARGKTWVLNRADYSLQQGDVVQTSNAPVEEDGAPSSSRRTGEETAITFSNQTEAEVELFWLDSEGERRSYGKVKAGEARQQHTFGGHVWLVADASGKTLGVFEAGEESTFAEVTGQKNVAQNKSSAPSRRSRSESQSPDGKWRAVFNNYNLSLTNFDTGQSVALTVDGTSGDAYSGRVYWSPDSRRLVVIKTHKGDDRKIYLIESSPKDQLQPKLRTVDYPKPGDQIAVERPHLFEIASAREIPLDDQLFPNPWSISHFQWSPDGTRFAFLYNQRGHQVLRLLRVDAESGKVTPVIDERSDTFIDYSGKLFLEYVEAGEGSEVIWMSERDGWNHLYLYDLTKAEFKNQITRGNWVVRGVDWVDKEKRQIWFRASGIYPMQDPYWIHYCRANFDGSGFTVLSAGEGTHQVRFSPERRFLVDTWSRVDQAPIIELRNAMDSSLVCKLEEADISELEAAKWRAPERFVAKGRDGNTDIYGIIHWPADYDPCKKYPVIESIYAGPQGSFVPKNFHSSYSQQKLADQGFIVVQIDGMGTSDRSKAFQDICWKNLGDSGFPDRILWMQAAAAHYASMDLGRVGIYGTSAGGQSALRALLAHGDFYKAAVADSGCHDNRMDKIWWNEQWMGWPVGPHYEEQSNVTQAHKLQGKLLLMVGELDNNVDPASTLQVVNALIKADKDFELLLVPGAGHGVLSSAYANRRMFEFFERHLLGRSS
jgi:dipeptidyl-peptidase-4